MLLIRLYLPACLGAHGEVAGRGDNILLLLVELLVMKAIHGIAHVVRPCVVTELDGLRAGYENALGLLLLLVAAMRRVSHGEVQTFATGVRPRVPLALLVVRYVRVLHQDLVRVGDLCLGWVCFCVLMPATTRFEARLVRVLAR